MIDRIIDDAQKNHAETVIWCRHCDLKWIIIVPFRYQITEETKDKEKLFRDLHDKVCPRCQKRMSPFDVIKDRVPLTHEVDEYGDKPWSKGYLLDTTTPCIG